MKQIEQEQKEILEVVSPIPTIRSLDQRGEMTLVFSEPVEVWDDFTDLKKKEVAFR